MDEQIKIVEILQEIKNLLSQNKKVLNVDDLAEYTGLSKSKIYKLTQLRLIPMGNNQHIRQKFFNKNEIDAWLLGEPILSDEVLEQKFSKQLLRNRKRGSLEIEKRTKKPVHQLFNLIAGTSFSAVLALYLTCKDENGNRIFSPQNYIKFFASRCSSIFYRSFKHKLRTMNGILEARYEVKNLIRELQPIFSNHQLKDVLSDVVLTSYELNRRSPFFFRSRLSRVKIGEDFSVCDIARAVTAMPTFFKPAQIKSTNGLNYSLIDASSILNNPTMTAYSEISRIYPNRNYLFISLGILSNLRPYNVGVNEWGMIQWLNPIFDITSQGQSSTIHEQIQSILPNNCYYRLEPKFVTASPYGDDITPQNIWAIENDVSVFIKDNTTLIDELCGRLSN